MGPVVAFVLFVIVLLLLTNPFVLLAIFFPLILAVAIVLEALKYLWPLVVIILLLYFLLKSRRDV